MPDAGGPVIDAGGPVIDAGGPVIDAGGPVIDAGGDAGGPPAVCNGSVDATIGGTNLIQNGTFESSVTGWTPAAASLLRIAGGHCGSFAARVTAGAAIYGIDDVGSTLTTPVARVYRASAWVRSEVAGASARIILGETYSNGVFAYTESTPVTLGTGWQKITLGRQTQPLSRSLEVYVVGTGGSFIVDDISLIAP